MIENLQIGPTRIRKVHIAECDLAGSRLWQRDRPRWRLDLRLRINDFEQTFCRSGCLCDFSPDLAELTEAARREHSIENKLPEPPGRDVTGKHVLRTDP